MLITISGEPGSGKTTVARLLSTDLCLPHVYAGDLYRREAARRKLSLADFSELCERDHSIDRALDAEMIAVAHRGDVILEGRLAGFFARRDSLPALKVWLTASEEVRARRVAQREQGDAESVLAVNRARHACDARRYRQIYGFDLGDTRIYDLLLNTDGETPQSLSRRIQTAARQRFRLGEAKR